MRSAADVLEELMVKLGLGGGPRYGTPEWAASVAEGNARADARVLELRARARWWAAQWLRRSTVEQGGPGIARVHRFKCIRSAEHYLAAIARAELYS